MTKRAKQPAKGQPDMVLVSVRVHFDGEVLVAMPKSVPEHRRRRLAEYQALCQVSATLENPDAPADQACGEYCEVFDISRKGEKEWDACQVSLESGSWSVD
jgi:hypothetical protein